MTGSRLPKNENTRINTKKPQYPIDRWQLDEYEASNPPQASPAQDSPAQMFPVFSNRPGTIQRSSGTTWFPLPADHLLHLVKYNVFRGLCQNKTTLETLAVQYDTANHPNGPFSDHKTFPRYSVILPKAPHRSSCLTPTPLQMSVVHSTWINFIPFPKIRDNLIKWEFAFDHSDLVGDLVGDLINLKIFLSTTTSSRPTGSRDPAAREGNNDEVPTDETGLILWGEPYLAESWEATPGFLRKWTWAVAGCQELIDSSNYWRGVRGERPLQLSVRTELYLQNDNN